MARRPTLSEKMREQLPKLKNDDLKVISRLPTLETDDPEFGSIFLKNPGAALAAKGLELTPKEIGRIEGKISEMSKTRAVEMDKVETEITVGIKVKF